MSPAHADSWQLQLVDQQGAPVADAVVSIPGRAVIANTSPVMDQINKQFVPHVLVIARGQSVSFPNSDNIRHHVYSFSEAKPFEIRLFMGTEAAPVTFDKGGIAVLGCNIHDQMLGFIYIADNELAMLSPASGIVTVDKDVQTVDIWHPRLSVNHTRRIRIDQQSSPQQVTLELLAPVTEEKTRFRSRFDQGAP